ncbi:hypothetical protein E2C01_019722 [Portunus trituberculatus]|uniref:Uncharacterized protein n=1 Tax=Portunus trituberculatus TaxID=210409 RepID=A0A5B7DYE3_PORTR|nr:hypothetical protein [Portunus trituberculatus]
MTQKEVAPKCSTTHIAVTGCTSRLTGIEVLHKHALQQTLVGVKPERPQPALPPRCWRLFGTQQPSLTQSPGHCTTTPWRRPHPHPRLSALSHTSGRGV